jgi:hypothetical protein
LPDTLEYLERLEAYLGKDIIKTTAGTTFDNILRMKGGMLPSNHRRYCTELMKLRVISDLEHTNEEGVDTFGPLLQV